MRLRFFVLPALFISFSGIQAQNPAPQTYSYTEDPGFPLMGPQVIKITRDGSKEVVDQIMPAGFAGRAKEYHGHLLYDFQAHKLYTQVLSDDGAPCGLQDYAEPAAPPEFDPVSGADALLKELTGKAQLNEIGTESVNGLPSRIMQVTSAQVNGKIWLAQNGGFPVKIVIVGPDGKEVTFVEVKQFSLAKPSPAAFTPPASCVALEAPPTPKPSTNVTALTLQPIPKYVGACPAHIKLTGTITTDGPGKVFYQFGAGTMEPGETLAFSAAGTKTVTHIMTFQPKFGNDMGGTAILEAIGADASGKHGASLQGSNNSDFTITCTTGGAH